MLLYNNDFITTVQRVFHLIPLSTFKMSHCHSLHNQTFPVILLTCLIYNRYYLLHWHWQEMKSTSVTDSVHKTSSAWLRRREDPLTTARVLGCQSPALTDQVQHQTLLADWDQRRVLCQWECQAIRQVHSQAPALAGWCPSAACTYTPPLKWSHQKNGLDHHLK